MDVSNKFKQAPIGWKIATPADKVDKGQWWQIFNDKQLNALEDKVNISNQNIALALARYKQSVAQLTEVSANYWPNVSLAAHGGRSKQGTVKDNVSLNPSVSWTPDVFGVISLAQQVTNAGTEASAAQLANTKLAMQALLAQAYFKLRALDITQKLLDSAVVDYKKLLKLTTSRYHSGISSRLDIVQTQTQLQSAIAQALDNKISRAQCEHSIAVLVGEIPDKFALNINVAKLKMPSIPLKAPSYLLERRPDIAQAERLVAQANTQIGLATAAYFPVITLTGAYGVASDKFSNLFSPANHIWSIGANLVENIFDGGARSAKIDGANAVYEQSVASYKQTVLTAFNEVEDNLVALRILESEVSVQASAVASADLALQITMNKYTAGTIAYPEVIESLATYYTAQKVAAMLYSRRMVAAVALIQALGGGWERV
jgi:NodT family efflux transporter outer membrane factor (OMF) lipoprotein